MRVVRVMVVVVMMVMPGYWLLRQRMVVALDLRCRRRKEIDV